jgi:TonB family protein
MVRRAMRMSVCAALGLLACSHTTGSGRSPRTGDADRASARRAYVQALDERIRARFAEHVAALVRSDPDACKYFAQEHSVAVLLDIDARGGIGEVRMVRSSGADALDQTVVDSIREAFPADPPPRAAVNVDGRFDTGYRLSVTPVPACAGAHPR